MEWNDLVEEILFRVKQKLQEQSAVKSEEKVLPCNLEKKLLILSETHSEECEALWKTIADSGKWSVECAAVQENTCSLSSVHTIVLCKISNTDLVKIANGMGDTPLTELAVQAILMGKKLIVLSEGLELLTYKDTAPGPYYDHMLQYVALLKRSGVLICDTRKLYAVLCEECAGEAVCEIKPQNMPTERKKQALHVTKRVLTERDIHEACTQQITEIQISEKTIVTDLARDYAKQREIRLVSVAS